MKNSLMMDFTVDKQNNAVHVKREFDAELPVVWKAWTDPAILDKWWAPKPWKSRTKKMEFKEGGRRLYAMVGPAGEEHWAIADFTSITAEKNIQWQDAFSDENGNINPDWPRSSWKIDFVALGEKTLVDIQIMHNSLADLEKIIEMGFREGFTMGLAQLDEILNDVSK